MTTHYMNEQKGLLLALRNLYPGNHKHHLHLNFCHMRLFWTAFVSRVETTNELLWYSAYS